MLNPSQLRWLAVGILILSSALNYLDRLVLSALMPVLQTELSLSREQLGLLVSAFSIVYAVSSPVMGLLVDRLGLRLGAAILVALWSLIGIGTGFAASFAGLMAFRAMLGFAEAGGVPATGKGFAMYLEPQSRAMGGALSQFGLTIGSMGAPLLTEWLLPRFGWQSVFVVSGALGLFWIPIWLWISAKAPAVDVPGQKIKTRFSEILGDRRLVALVIANILAMTIYSLWTNWTTVFLVSQFKLSREVANVQFAWIPPIFATAGGLFGAFLARQLILRGMQVLRARVQISLVSSCFALATAAAAAAGSPNVAIAMICLSLAATTCLSVNYYAIPLDLFGAPKAAFAVSLLTGVFGLMQTFLAPLIGRWSQQQGWQPVCTLVSVMPFVSAVILWAACRDQWD